MSAHVVPARTYYLVFAALLVLTALTVVARLMPLGPAHTPIALGIAAAKSTLVLLFFMHVLYSSRLIWVVALSGLVWLAILIALTMSDYLTRPSFFLDNLR